MIDFHCHLDLYPDFEQLVEECDRQGIYTLAVTTTPRAWSRNRELCERTKYVRAGLGLHPQLAGEHWREIDLWERFLSESEYIGEVGLDAGPSHYRSLDRQKDVFGRILKACAGQGGKILSVHSVRAVTQVLDMVEEHLPRDRGTIVLHWFTGSLAEARRAVALGCFFSINGQMLRNERGFKLLKSLPEDRLLSETDGPFTENLGKPLRPLDVAIVIREMAACLGQDFEDCRRRLLTNLRTLTGGLKHSTG